MTNLQKAINLVEAIGSDVVEFTNSQYIDAIVSQLGVSRNNASIYLAKAKRALGFFLNRNHTVPVELLWPPGLAANVDLEVSEGPTKVDCNPTNKPRAKNKK